MVRRIVSSTIFILVLALLGSQPAQANTPLTRAIVSSLRNQVRLLPDRRPARKAKLSDVLKPGDGIVTSRRSLAELRFNDGSLARMGEQAVFRFIPKTRSFRLSNGTVLMLIPPGQGRTQVRTPNVTAGIRGSALIIRYDKGTDTSTVIALTNSQISVTNREKSQTQVLAAGQAVVTIGDEIVDSYDVDLQELYRTSQLLKDLEMNNPDAEVKDEAIAQVREETLEGIESQRSFALGEGNDLTEEFRLSELNVDSVIADETGRPFGTALPGIGAESTRFPGRSIGVNGRFNEDGVEQPVIPAVIPAATVEVPPTTVIADPPPVNEIPPVADQSPINEPVAEPPMIVEPTIVEAPVVVEPPAVDELPVIDAPIADSPIIDDPIAETPVDAVDNIPVVDDIAGEIAPPLDDTPIAEVDSLPEDIPIFGDDTAALEPELPEDVDISPPEIEVPMIPEVEDTIAEVDDIPDVPDVEVPMIPEVEDTIAEVDDIPDVPDVEVPTIPEVEDTISEVDNLPEEIIPGFGDDTAALEDPDPSDDVANGDIPEPTVDIGVTITVTVTVDGEQQEFEDVDTSVFQTPTAADTSLEPSPEDTGASADPG